MKHYGIDQWVDFARGIVQPEEAEMRRHLDAGCSACRELAGFCTDMSSMGRELASVSVPEWVLHNARAIFPVRQAPVRRRAWRIPVELVYDSFLVPAPAGMRATWQVGWQALYRAGDCSLDLRIEPDLNSSRAAVIGQVSNHMVPADRMEGIPVYVKSGRLIVAETRSNRFGEFQMEYEQQNRLQLCVDLDNGAKRFQVALKKLASDRAAGAARAGASAFEESGPHRED